MVSEESNAILVINCGSSSVKFSLIKPESGESFLSGLAQRLNTEEASIKIKYTMENKEEAFNQSLKFPYDHIKSLEALVEKLKELSLDKGITAIGHRIVHGGDLYSEPTLINDKVKKAIQSLAKLAPLHNPANLTGIDACQAAFEGLPQVAVFDTAFHQTMPSKAFLYGIPKNLFEDYGIRRYGFHGTSHYFVAIQAAKYLNKPLSECNVITAHLGNGCSIAAIENGKSVDTSMGMTPLEGVMMGTRSGDIDAGVIFHLANQLNYSVTEIEKTLIKESGLLGISAISNDCRALEEAMESPENPHQEQAKLALNIFCYKIAKYIASYSVCFNRLDALVFTGGIGENSPWVRQNIIKQLALLNFHLASEENERLFAGACGNITTESSRPCFVITTNEEWVIAEQTQQLLSNN
jgi:acetate kinase